jgi:glycosyltransferase involved in cell wall biosynthesis
MKTENARLEEMSKQTITPRTEKIILIVDLGGVMGGVEYYIETLSGMLMGRANFLSLCVPAELARRLRSKGMKVYRLPAFHWFKAVRFLLAALVLPFVILREHVQIVVINGLLESVLLIPARLLGCEAIYARHGPFEDDLYKWYAKPWRYFPRLTARLCARFASRVICVSEDVGKGVRRVVPEERVSVIPLWVPQLPPYSGGNRQLASPVRLLYVGRLERYKGLYLLLEAIRDISNVRLTVVGDGSHRKHLEELARGLDVQFEGFQSDPTQYYANTDIFVMPSLGPEGFGIVTMEAMAHGLPCLISDLDVHKEITATGTAAMLFRSGDAEDLRQKLCLLIEEAQLRTRYSSAGHRRVQEVYSQDIALKHYVYAFGL